ncbi:high frequency lysogenization protein HflD [Acidithiobacillus sp.]|uniref:high frequency lysogenization protein HflD n=1 Tax=Acidithiobacillus sp. TaxID=1872118 RepID=UPI0025C2B99D|nr:high frequency lysogenization protein HflD [Acidithiobacillus sp.]
MWSFLLPDARRRRDRALALAGVLRSALLVQNIARNGSQPGELLQTCIQSVLALDSQDSLRALGDIDSLRQPLALLCPLLRRGPGNAQEAELLRYSMALVTLGRRLRKNPSATRRVQEGIEQAQRQVTHFADPTQRSIIAGLAQTYTEAIGTLRPRIIVSGESRFLSDPDDAARIRTLLLSGIRAAVLWRQAGGHLPGTILERRGLCQEAEELLATHPQLT